jgi:hypothetical protein
MSGYTVLRGEEGIGGLPTGLDRSQHPRGWLRVGRGGCRRPSRLFWGPEVVPLDGRRSDNVSSMLVRRRLAAQLPGLFEEQSERRKRTDVLRPVRGFLRSYDVLKSGNWDEESAPQLGGQASPPEIFVAAGPGRLEGEIEIPVAGGEVEHFHLTEEGRIASEWNAFGHVLGSNARANFAQGRGESCEVLGVSCGANVGVAGPKGGPVKGRSEASNNDVLDAVGIQGAEELAWLKGRQFSA